MKNQIIQFKNITKKYSGLIALDKVCFEIPENSIFGILGANGSGKSTLMKIMAGLIKEWSGEVIFKGESIKKDDLKTKKDFGFLIESPTFYEYLSAYRNLEILARISNVDSKRINHVLELVGLTLRSDDLVSSFSYGMKQRLGIAQVLLHNPKVVVLDEPNNGLDPNGVSDMIRLIKNMKSEGKTICISTHNLRDVEEMCTDFTVFNKGVSSGSNSMSFLFSESCNWSLIVKNPNQASNIISKNEKLEQIDHFNNKSIIKADKNQKLEDINKIFSSSNVLSINKESNLIDYFKND